MKEIILPLIGYGVLIGMFPMSGKSAAQQRFLHDSNLPQTTQTTVTIPQLQLIMAKDTVSPIKRLKKAVSNFLWRFRGFNEVRIMGVNSG